VPTLRILARAGAVANRADAIRTLTAVANQKVPGKSLDQFARLELDAVELTGEAAGNSGAADYQILLGETASGPQWQAVLRTEMAWWMYRAGNLKDAVAELEAAHQAFPTFGPAMMWRAWVDSDYAHQADAENDVQLSINAGMDNNSEFVSTQSAARAVISWRTEKKDLAKSQFQAAASEDEVWMVHNWATNNFSPATAAILFQLQAAEAARREEEAKKKREHQ
jgi:hypothetical protein